VPNAAWVSGSFHYTAGDRPVAGTVRFTPQYLWVFDQGVYWATLAPEVELDENGRFGAWLTVTDPWWSYLMETPAGVFHFHVPGDRVTYTLPELLNVDHPGERPA
jgi:hypothetical protein